MNKQDWIDLLNATGKEINKTMKEYNKALIREQVWKALNNEVEIYVLDDDNSIFIIDEFIANSRYTTATQLFLSDSYSGDWICLNHKDYGKSWSLCREDLDKEK